MQKDAPDSSVIPSSRLVYEVAKSMRLIRTDYSRRLSVLGNEGRRIAEYYCLLVFGHLGDPEVLQSEALAGQICRLPAWAMQNTLGVIDRQRSFLEGKLRSVFDLGLLEQELFLDAHLHKDLKSLHQWGHRAHHAGERINSP